MNAPHFLCLPGQVRLGFGVLISIAIQYKKFQVNYFFQSLVVDSMNSVDWWLAKKLMVLLVQGHAQGCEGTRDVTSLTQGSHCTAVKILSRTFC